MSTDFQNLISFLNSHLKIDISYIVWTDTNGSNSPSGRDLSWLSNKDLIIFTVMILKYPGSN